jgi:hypothetical protein
LATLGVVTGTVTLDGEKPYDVITKAELEGYMRYLVSDHGVGIEQAAELIKVIGEPMVADMASIATLVRKSTEEKVEDFKFELNKERPDHGHFYAPFGCKSPHVYSFSSALMMMMYQCDTYKTISGEATIKLLRDVLEADLPIESDKDRGPILVGIISVSMD